MYGLYLDETGIGKLTHEPVLVVAGVLIHADTQWRALSDHLRGLLVNYTPSGQPVPSHLHATDIYAGRGEFHRDRWPENVRLQLLDELADTPWKFGLPVVWGAKDRISYAKEHEGKKPLQHLIDCYSVAAMVCFMQTEWYMRYRAPTGQLVSITLEQNNELQKRIKEIYHFAQTDSILEMSEGNPAFIQELLPLTRIIDAPSFQEKTSSSILQLSDFCAWTFKRAVGLSRDYERFAKPLSRTALTWRPGQTPIISAPVWGAGPGYSFSQMVLGRRR